MKPSQNLTWNPNHVLDEPTIHNGFEPDGTILEFEEPQIHLVVLHHIIIIFWTLLGNILMIFVIFKHNMIMGRRKLTAVQTLLLNLCVSDILFACLTIFSNMLIELTAPTFHGPVVLCKFVKFLQVIPLYSSSFLLVAISIDRYYAICRPLAHMRASQNRPRIYAVLAWLLAIVASIPQIFIFTKDTRGEVATELSYTHFQHQVYVVFFNVAVWLLPTIVAGILYCRVCHAVWCSMIYDDSYSFSWPNSRSVFSRRSLLSRSSTKFSFRSFRDRTSSNQSNHPVELQSLSNPATPTERIGYIGSNQKEEQEKKRIQTVKLTMTIVIAHFVLWAPFCIVNVIDAFAPQSINPILATHLMFLGNINSVMNPWIWFAFNYDSAKLAIRTSVREFRLERQRQSQRKRQSQDLSMDIATTASMMHSYENGL